MYYINTIDNYAKCENFSCWIQDSPARRKEEIEPMYAYNDIPPPFLACVPYTHIPSLTFQPVFINVIDF